MAIWIVTTGGSDILLNKDGEKNWNNLYAEAKSCPQAKSQLPQGKFSPKLVDDDNKGNKTFTISSRILGIVYEKQLDIYYQDLKFPLLDSFADELKNQKIHIDKIFIIITDQSKVLIDKEERKKSKYPYWQDTCTCKVIFEKYFRKHEHFKNTQLNFLALTPKDGSKGLDYWDSTLKLVQEELARVDFDGKETIYVSHQAGTPAISSAVQFVSLGRFGEKVKFIVGNEYSQETDIIGSSAYLQGIKIQQAKKLIINGQPSSALELLKGISDIDKIVTSGGKTIISELEMLVNLFNFKAPDDSQNEFEPISAIKRVRQALDLAEIFFKNEDYLPGVNVLAAAHETFLKAAILYKIRHKNPMVGSFEVSQLVKWDHRGFCLQKKSNLTTRKVIILNNNENLSTLLDFPVPKEIDKEKEQESSYDYISWQKYLSGSQFTLGSLPRDTYFKLNDSRLRKWLIKLEPELTQWELMKWCFTHFRTHELDLRNQNLHNLLGVRKIDVIRYLLGNLEDPKITNSSQKAKDKYKEYKDRESSLKVEDVVTVYTDFVKNHFLETLKKFGWNDDNYTPLQDQLAELANSLDAEVKKTDS